MRATVGGSHAAFGDIRARAATDRSALASRSGASCDPQIYTFGAHCELKAALQHSVERSNVSANSKETGTTTSSRCGSSEYGEPERESRPTPASSPECLQGAPRSYANEKAGRKFPHAPPKRTAYAAASAFGDFSALYVAQSVTAPIAKPSSLSMNCLK